MTKKLKVLFVGLLLAVAVCLLLLLLKPRQRQSETAGSPAQNETGSRQPSRSEKSRAGDSNVATSGSRKVPPLSPSATPLAEAIAQTNPLAGQLLGAWQGAIEFYGKVVDENSNAVAGAQVSFHWVEIPDATGNRTATTKSDAEGRFSLQGERGLSLGVSVSKEGYYASRRDNDTFVYGSIGGGQFSPDPQNPAVFHLRKSSQGAELITSENGVQPKVSVRLPKDGTPVRVDLLGKQVDAAGQLVVSQNKPPWKEARQWSFQMSIPGGGLVENTDEFQFEAPETNYQQTVEYHFTRDETNWTTHVTKQFYIAFGQPPRYGWLRIESDLSQETIFLTYAINPTGSRNLEPMEAKPPVPALPPGVRAVIPELK